MDSRSYSNTSKREYGLDTCPSTTRTRTVCKLLKKLNKDYLTVHYWIYVNLEHLSLLPSTDWGQIHIIQHRTEIEQKLSRGQMPPTVSVVSSHKNRDWNLEGIGMAMGPLSGNPRGIPLLEDGCGEILSPLPYMWMGTRMPPPSPLSTIYVGIQICKFGLSVYNTPI